MSFVISQKADDDLTKIWFEIAQLTKNIDFADNFVDDFDAEFMKLTKFVKMGEYRDNIIPNFRKWTFKKYIIYYSTERGYIRIERVLWGKQDQESHLKP